MNGVLVVNKESGMTSFDVIRKIKRILNIDKIGHTGTLDPMATGVLLILLGDATKISNYLMSDVKGYEFDVAFGIKTDTEDITGKIIHTETPLLINNQIIDDCLLQMVGKQTQIPPMYSAIKIDGQKLYELARKGIEVKRNERAIEVFEISRISDCYFKDGYNCVKLRAIVSKGTYIRTLASNIGERLNTCSTLTTLNRTFSGTISLDDSYSLDDIEKGNYRLINLVEATKHYYQLEVNDYIKNKVLHGMKISFKDINSQEDVIFFVEKDKLLGIYKRSELCYKAERIWN